jgi:tRNA pseudouridine32 synthase / 23S rRNA pseudouridine746 synthase
MNNPLPTDLATAYCIQLQATLDTQRCLDYEGERQISTDYLFGKARGQMFGVLVCLDPQGDEVILKAFSGQYNSQWLIPGWVAPMCDPTSYNWIMQQNNEHIQHLTQRISECKAKAEDCSVLQAKRRSLSQSVMAQLFKLYEFRCIDDSIATINDIFGAKLPPSGTGDCCAPKLLHYAFNQRLKPISMAEFFYGKPNGSASRLHKQFYAPCDDKCKPLLTHMLGLDIVYCDDSLVVVNKPSGLLSVPGRGVDMQDCVESRIKLLFPHCIDKPAVHRLDMDTSGLLVLARTQAAHRNLSIQFMRGEVRKEYVALVEGLLSYGSGSIELPFRLDVENRPYQMYDEIHGKVGKTLWRTVRAEYYTPPTLPGNARNQRKLVTRVLFTPLTGRTHQLRVHSAHGKGLAHPIVGDRLYGNAVQGERLLLHACSVTFIHPETNEHLVFSSDAEF